MNVIDNILKHYPVVILDGALGTELENRGCDLNDKLWSSKVLMENPEIIKEIHKDYFAVGADCAISATYQATIEGFIDKGMTKEEAILLMKKAVQIAIDARDEFWSENQSINRPKPFVAAAVGPYGAYLVDGSEFKGGYKVTENELVEFHRERIKILIETGAEMLACETIPCLSEAKELVKVLKEFPNTYAWIAFSAKDELHISNGETIAECAAFLDKQEQITAIGINCTAPKYVYSLIKEIKNNTSKPIIVYPNSGEVYDVTSKTWDEQCSVSNFGEDAKEWYKSGAAIIGGCCRTKPSDIAEITEWVRG